MLAQLGKEMGTERFQQLKQLAQAVVADQRSWCKHAVLALCMYACFLLNQPWLHASVQRHCYVIVLMPSLAGVATAPLATEALLKKIYIKRIGHHARPRRASATAPLRTGADRCRTGVGAGSSAGADKGPDRRQSNHEWTDDQAGRRRLANTDSDGGSPVPMTPGRGGSEQAVFVVQWRCAWVTAVMAGWLYGTFSVSADSFLHAVASPVRSFVTT